MPKPPMAHFMTLTERGVRHQGQQEAMAKRGIQRHIFFEFMQRKGGDGNFRTLFYGLKQDQTGHGVLEAESSARRH